MNEEDFKAMDRKQAADDRKAYAQHLRINSSFEKKLLGLEPLLRGKIVTCRRLSALDDGAVQRRLWLGYSIINFFFIQFRLQHCFQNVGT